MADSKSQGVLNLEIFTLSTTLLVGGEGHERSETPPCFRGMRVTTYVNRRASHVHQHPLYPSLLPDTCISHLTESKRWRRQLVSMDPPSGSCWSTEHLRSEDIEVRGGCQEPDFVLNVAGEVEAAALMKCCSCKAIC